MNTVHFINRNTNITRTHITPPPPQKKPSKFNGLQLINIYIWYELKLSKLIYNIIIKQ